MKFKRRRREEPLIEMAPLIDVVFLLLLFFMVTTRFVSMPGLKLILPGVSPGQSVTATDRIEVQVTAAGDIFVDGNPVAETHLRTAIRKGVRDLDSAVVVVSADQDTAHGRVIAVMDAIRQGGLKRVVMAAKWKKEGQDR